MGAKSTAGGLARAFYLLILDKQTHYCTIVINAYAGGNMDVVIDTSALIAVIVGEPERNRIVELEFGGRS